VAALVARNANEDTIEPIVGSGGVCVWRQYGVGRPVLCRYVWHKSGFNCHEDVFTFNLHF